MVVIEAEAEYDRNMHIELGFGKGTDLVNFGVSELTLKGRIEILLGPRTERIPFFSAHQIAFLNPPELDYKLTGLAAIAKSALFRKNFRRITERLLNKIWVLPTRKCIPNISHVDFLQCTVDHIGVLRKRLISGHKFPNTDFSFAGIEKVEV